MLLVVGMVLLWQTGFVCWAFWCMCTHGGYMVVYEPILWLRWAELAVSTVMLALSVSVSVWFWYEYIKYERRQRIWEQRR